MFFLKPISFVGKSLGIFFIPNLMGFFSHQSSSFPPTTYVIVCNKLWLTAYLPFWTQINRISYTWPQWHSLGVRTRKATGKGKGIHWKIILTILRTENLASLCVDCIRDDSDVLWKRQTRKEKHSQEKQWELWKHASVNKLIMHLNNILLWILLFQETVHFWK